MQAHMEAVHRVYQEFDILLAVNFLDAGEKDEIIERVRKKVFGKNDDITENDITRIEDVDMQVKENIMENYIVSQSQDIYGLHKDDASVQYVDQDYQASHEIPFKMPKGLEIIPFTKVPSDTMNEDSMELAEVTEAPVTISNISNNIGIQKAPSMLWKCPNCGQKFPNHHKQKHEGMKTLCWTSCKKCWMQFTIPGELRKHIKISKKCRKQNKTKMLKCGDCERIFFSKMLFEKHEARKLSTKTSCKKEDIKCDNCNKCFKSMFLFEKHREKPCLKLLACSKCGKLMNEAKYKWHVKREWCVRQNDSLGKKCTNCLRVFNTKKGLRQHLRKQKPSSDYPTCKTRILCARCGKKCFKESYLMHLCKIPCERCGVQFSETKLKQHSSMKKKCNPKGMRCKFCDELIAGISGLREHIDVNHKEEETASNVLLKEENFRCSGCDRSFSSNRYLVFHQLSKKNCPQYKGNKEVNQGPITCTICYKEFKYLANLAMHQTKKDGCFSKAKI